LRIDKKKITSLFAAQTTALNCTLEASYEISLLIAKKWEESYDWGTTC